jgi:hypothetical protein
MKKQFKSIFILTLFLSATLLACSNSSDEINADASSAPPAGVGGKWSYGTFSPSSFWGTDGSYNGAAYEQAMAFNFASNGTYEMYVMNVATYYGCRTGAYTYWKGQVKFDEANQSITLTPLQGTQRGEYSCASGKNFKRNATASEIENAHQIFYYKKETDSKGKPALRLYSSENDSQGAQLTKGNW